MRVEVLGGVERRRRWSHDDKMRIIEETLAPGAVVTEIARRHGIATSLVFTWRQRRINLFINHADPVYEGCFLVQHLSSCRWP